MATAATATATELVRIQPRQGWVGLDWKEHVVHDPGLSRAGDVPALVADPRRAAERLDWQATTPFESLLDEMLDAARVALAVAPTPAAR